MGNFFRIQDFIDGVQSRSGNNLIAYVATFKDDEQIKDFLQYTYDKKKYVYGVRVGATNVGYSGHLDPDCDRDWIKLVNSIELLNELGTNNTATKQLCIELLEEFGVVAYTILNRKIPTATLGASVVNKAIPNLIPEFKIAKAKNLELSRVIEGNYYYAERKYDGNNIYIIEGKCYTREGHRVYLPYIENKLKHISGVIVTECCVGEGKLGERSVTQGLMTKGRKKTITIDEQKKLKFYMIDYLIIGDWDIKECTVNYEDRLAYFWTEYGDYYGSTILYEVLRQVVTSVESVKKMLLSELKLGYEGIVIKPMHHKYQYKRSWDWMRYKEAKTADLLVVGFEYGTGKHSGKLGSIICEGRVEGIKVNVKVGQGFKDYEREIEYYEDILADSIVEITYNEVTPDGSLTIPIFVDVRFDKENSNNA